MSTSASTPPPPPPADGPPPPVTVVTVTYNSQSTIGPWLDALEPAVRAGVCECVVIDNNSTDSTPAVLRERGSWARVWLTGQNVGFGRGCNMGLGLSRTRYTLFLNPDGHIGPEGLRAMADFMDAHPSAAICTPAIVEPDDGLQFVGSRTTPALLLREAFAGATPRRRVRPGEAPFRTDWVCGAAMFVRTEAVRALGGFDPRFFLYFEETDLCKRAEEAGHEIWAVGQAVAHHTNAVSAKTSKRRMYTDCIAEFYFQSRFYFLVKHWGWPTAAATEVLECAAMAVRCGVMVLRGKDPGGFPTRWASPMLSQPKPVAPSASETFTPG
jgi:N-acetylglucosaminyl-diphospho-decaprenol L-rhamnosyltransferase